MRPYTTGIRRSILRDGLWRCRGRWIFLHDFPLAPSNASSQPSMYLQEKFREAGRLSTNGALMTVIVEATLVAVNFSVDNGPAQHFRLVIFLKRLCREDHEYKGMAYLYCIRHAC